MSKAEKFQAWKAAHYPTASRVHTQMMYAAWCASTDWSPKAAAPAPKPKPKPKAKPKAKVVNAPGAPGDE